MSKQIEYLYRLQKKDLPKAGVVLADAFQHDPLWKEILAGSTAIQKRSTFESPVRFCREYGEAYATSENLEGIAGWVPGTMTDITLWRLVRSGAIGLAFKAGAQVGKKVALTFKPLKHDREENMKGKSFIYLLIMGVATEFQGKGFGGALLRAVISKSEQAGLPLYLETETESNVRLYEKFGFTLVKQVIIPAFNLPMWELKRESKARS